jgi:hypothetical protein
MTPTLSAESKSAPVQSTPEGPYLVLDLDNFLPCFNKQSCHVGHRLCNHPYFEMPSLIALAKRLPPKLVRINNGTAPVDATPAEIPGAKLSIDESFASIGEGQTRIMLKGIENDPAYGDLLRTCLAELEALGHPATRGIVAREGYVFISSPNMITPYHMDPEINFLLQVRGRKTFYVFSGDDRSILSEEDIELFYAGKHDHLNFKEEAKSKAVAHDMQPGDGVHIPVNHPHWVKTYNDVTISFALTLQTAATKRRGNIYSINHQLRRLGLKPKPYGKSALRDFLKHNSFRAWRFLRACLFLKNRPPAH